MQVIGVIKHEKRLLKCGMGDNMSEKTATIKDVARKAEVSLATVSRVINDIDGVKTELRQKVLQAIEELGYNPNHAARALVKKRTNSIGVIVNNLHDPFFYDLIRGFETAAQQSSYTVVYCSVLGGDAQDKEKYVKYLTNGVVDAVILYGSYITDESVVRYLREGHKMDYVMIENDLPDFACNKLLIDNKAGARQAVEYLIGKGHRSIAHICGNPNKRVSIDRLNGYIEAMQAAGLEVREHDIQHTSTDYHSGYARMEALLDTKKPPTAVFCSDDAIASFAVRAATARSLQIPGDISIMGFDNQTILPDHYRGPEITSVEQPLYTIGFESIQLLSKRLQAQEAQAPVKKLYSTKIIEKETVGEYRQK